MALPSAHSAAKQSRIDQISGQFLGLPYVNGPLGEGPGSEPDSDPLIRFDQFDCTTYIETVMAMNLAKTSDEVLPWMNFIRYNSPQISFKTRNHVTSYDWIPHLTANHLVDDVTRSLFKNDYKTKETLITKASWFKKMHNIEDNTPAAIVELDYLPKEAILKNPKLLNNIPDGSIINYVRKNWINIEKTGTDLAVSHQGLLIVKNGVPYFRHASSAKAIMAVTEEPLINYIKGLKSNSTHLGINILKIR